jgi:hypothetical protein
VDVRIPDYAGGSLANLMCELEGRLGGTPPLPGLHRHLSDAVPEAETYVVVLFDGLGAHQLRHPAAGSLREAAVAHLDATFPSTTVVGLATVATGLAPAGHGMVSHFLRLEGHGVVNALKWRTLRGTPARVDTSALLPTTLWERLGAAGVETITVQPGGFEGSPTSRLLYRGARFESVWSPAEWVDAIVATARVRGRLVFAYWPDVDTAAHVAGQASDTYLQALSRADALWSGLVARLPPGVTAIATADHGHVDYPAAAKEPLGKAVATVFGDPRVLLLDGDDDGVRSVLAGYPGTLLHDPRPLFGPGDHPALAHRLPSHAFLVDRGRLVIPSFMDDRLVGYHGGLEPEELEVPLVVRAT